MAKCAYRDKRMIEIEEKWIDENIKDEEEKEWEKDIVRIILEDLGIKANCNFEAIKGREFCIFHDPEYWKNHEEEIHKEFLKLLENNEEKIFIGFHLLEITFPKVVNGNLLMPLTKFHGILSASTTFEGEVDFTGATFEKLANFSKVTFEGGVDFDGLCFEERNFIVFRSSLFKKPHLVSFNSTEINNFLFLSTDIENISLSNTKFQNKVLKVHELLREFYFTGFTFDDVIETYGRLRGNLEKNHRFSDAGRFFYGEMEARRERKYYEILKEHKNKEKFIFL